MVVPHDPPWNLLSRGYRALRIFREIAALRSQLAVGAACNSQRRRLTQTGPLEAWVVMFVAVLIGGTRMQLRHSSLPLSPLYPIPGYIWLKLIPPCNYSGTKVHPRAQSLTALSDRRPMLRAAAGAYMRLRSRCCPRVQLAGNLPPCRKIRTVATAESSVRPELSSDSKMTKVAKFY